MAEATTLTVVGCGTLLPDDARRSSCYHLAVPREGDPAAGGILLDCGTGALHGLAAEGIDWRAIDAVALTHWHTDHVGDVAALLGALRHAGRTRPLALLGPEDLPAWLDRLAAVVGQWIPRPGFPLDLVPLTPGRTWARADGRVRLAARPTPHTDRSLALRLSGPWGTLGYTGDTGPSEEVARFMAGCDVLLSECALADPPEMETHLSPRGVQALAAAAEPRILIVTHVYPPRDGAMAAAEVAAGWSGRVVPARAGMRVRISPAGPTVDPEAGAS